MSALFCRVKGPWIEARSGLRLEIFFPHSSCLEERGDGTCLSKSRGQEEILCTIYSEPLAFIITRLKESLMYKEKENYFQSVCACASVYA